MHTTTMNWSAHLPTEFNKALEQAVGFESMLNRLFTQPTAGGGYPPYNLRKEGEYTYVLELAVAGFTEDQLEVTVEDGTLTVGTVKALEPAELELVHKGIATRAFSRKFTLSDDLVVESADLKNGMLTVRMERIIPEDKKARIIKIGEGTSKPKGKKQLLQEEK